MFNLQGKVILVTGAAGGIGQALVTSFASAGATIVLSGRDVTKLEVAKSFIKGVECFAISADLSKDGEALRLVDETVRQAGRIDILVNNAGITKDTLLMRMSDEHFDDVLNTNLRSCFQMCRAAVMPMMKQKSGRIINMASIVGVIGAAGQANYAASKGGMIALTKSIAAEVATRGITVNAIAPGFIKTAMTDVLPEDIKSAYLKQIPAGRFGEASDIGGAAVFLASDEASYITGQTIHINGGLARF